MSPKILLAVGISFAGPVVAQYDPNWCHKDVVSGGQVHCLYRLGDGHLTSDFPTLMERSWVFISSQAAKIDALEKQLAEEKANNAKWKEATARDLLGKVNSLEFFREEENMRILAPLVQAAILSDPMFVDSLVEKIEAREKKSSSRGQKPKQ